MVGNKSPLRTRLGRGSSWSSSAIFVVLNCFAILAFDSRIGLAIANGEVLVGGEALASRAAGDKEDFVVSIRSPSSSSFCGARMGEIP